VTIPIRLCTLTAILVSSASLACNEADPLLSPDAPEFMRATYSGAVEKEYASEDADFYSFTHPETGVLVFTVVSNESESAIWIWRLGASDIGVGEYPLEGLNTEDGMARGVTVTVLEGGRLYQSLTGRLDIDAVSEMRVEGTFSLAAAEYCVWGSPSGCVFDPLSVGPETPRINVVGSFAVARDTATVPVLGGPPY